MRPAELIRHKHEGICPSIEGSSSKPAKIVWRTCISFAVLAEADAIITMVIRSTAVLGAFVPYTLDRNNRQSDLPDRVSLPRKRAKRYRRQERKKEARGGPNSPPSSEDECSVKH